MASLCCSIRLAIDASITSRNGAGQTPIQIVTTISGAKIAISRGFRSRMVLRSSFSSFPNMTRAVEIEHIGRAQNDACGRQRRDPGIGLERADQDQELAHEAAGSRQADGCQHEYHEDQRVFGHSFDETAIARDLPRMYAVVDDADAQEQRARYEAVADHLHHRALYALMGEREDADGDEPHMRDRRIGDQLFHIFLRQRHQRRIDHGHDRQGVDQRGVKYSVA